MNCGQNCVEGAAGNCRQDIVSKTESKTPKRILKCGKETTSLNGVAGNCNIVLMIMSRMMEEVAVICNRTML